MANLVADARALSAGQYGHLVVYGSTAVGDGGGGFYIWNAASTASDDGADWLKPDSITHPAPGRWQRVWSSIQAATTLLAGIVMLGTNGETTAGEAVQCSDTRLHPATTLAGTPAYITLDGATQVITRALVNLASHVTGTLPVLNGGTGAGTAGAAFDALKQLATETTTGVVELATSAETTAGLAIQASDTRLYPAISGLTDTTITSVANNDVLKYSSTAGKWINGLETAVLFGTTAGTSCEGNDDRIPSPDEQSFLAMVTKSGDNFTITPAGIGTITFDGNIIISGNVTVTDGVNTVVITPTTELIEV